MKIRRDPLDILFSKLVRMAVYSDGEASCEYCGATVYDSTKENGDIYPAWQKLECSHFYGRRRLSTRHDIDNGAALCRGCHAYLGEHPDAHVDFWKKRLGSDRFEELQARERTLIKLSKADKEKLKESLKEKIRELER